MDSLDSFISFYKIEIIGNLLQLIFNNLKQHITIVKTFLQLWDLILLYNFEKLLKNILLYSRLNNDNYTLITKY